MDNNVKIVLGNGDVLDAVGISYIHNEATNKDYIFYSLNELANGNMDKIYIAEASQNGTTPGPISDDEWANIKQIMLTISHSEPVNGITYKPLVGMTINVGDAKKLAIKGDKKQAFIDAQNKAIAPDTEIDEPAFVSDQAANGSPFFASDVSADGKTETKEVPEEKVQSAFAMEPPVQQDVQMESLDDTPAESPSQQIIQPNQVVETIDTSVAAPQSEQPAPVQEAPVQVVETVQAVVPEQQVVETVQAVVPEQNVVQTVTPEQTVVNQVDGPAIPVVENVPSDNPTNTNVNVEELKQAVIEAQAAIDRINNYLNAINATPVNTVKTVVVDTVQTQTVSTGTSPVSTETMVVADQPELKTDELVDETPLVNPADVIVPTEMVIPEDPAQVAAQPVQPEVITQPVETIQAVVPAQEVVQPTMLDTSVPVQDNIINTAVPTDIDSSVVPIQIEPLESTTTVNEEPAFSVDDSLETTQTLDLTDATVPQSTPNSAVDINNSSVMVNVPEAPVVENIAPVIPIAPTEATGIPTADIIPTVALVAPAAPAAPEPVSSIIPPQSNIEEVQQEVQGVPEISVAPVQQVPTLDLSAINTNVTLPTDMTSNPNPGANPGGVLGPATLDANDQAA